ncbi:hypothetical protein [Bradyrhizobium sp. B117]|uniref:hypothetical protein n=1 Tax=Bradyrhizobium sp. B117 TaxID=3140246 RepID=UPI0031837A67
MSQPTDNKGTFTITLTVTDPAAMRAEALRCYLAAGGEEEHFIAITTELGSTTLSSAAKQAETSGCLARIYPGISLLDAS